MRNRPDRPALTNVRRRPMREIHEELGNRADAWLTWGATVWEAAKRVRTSRRPPPPSNSEELMLMTDAVYAMLLGYTLEVLLKGLWVKKGNKVVVDGKYRHIVEGAGHDLLALGRKVGIEATKTEFDALNRLSPFILFAGRYPISIRHEDMKPRRVAGRKGNTVPGFYSGKDFEVAEILRNRLMASLRFDG